MRRWVSAELSTRNRTHSPVAKGSLWDWPTLLRPSGLVTDDPGAHSRPVSRLRLGSRIGAAANFDSDRNQSGNVLDFVELNL